MELRTYYKNELASLYCPQSTPANARKTFWRWMRHHPTLLQELEAIHYNPARKSFLRREVEIIIKCLGEP